MTWNLGILNDDNPTDQYTGIYFKDEEPLVIDKLKGDIALFYGASEIADVFDPALQLHPKWDEYIVLSDDNFDILEIPIQKATEGIHIRDSGYWQVSTQISNAEEVLLTYSMPLIDEDGNAFGVLGVGIDEEYLHLMVSHGSHSELAEGSSLGHILATVNEDTKEIIPALIYSDIQNTIVPLGIPLELNPINEELSLYKIENTDTDFPVLCSIYSLDLYGETSFDDKNWFFLGLANTDKLEASSTNFIIMLYLASLGVIIGGAILAFLVGLRLARPIVTLANKVETNDIETILSLSKTKSGYSEIDALAEAIERFNRKEQEAHSKTDNIIHMVNLPLGTFEYDKNTDVVTCSETLLELIDLSVEENTTIDSQLFFQKINEIKKNVEDEQNNIYNTKQYH